MMDKWVPREDTLWVTRHLRKVSYERSGWPMGLGNSFKFRLRYLTDTAEYIDILQTPLYSLP